MDRKQKTEEIFITAVQRGESSILSILKSCYFPKKRLSNLLQEKVLLG